MSQTFKISLILLVIVSGLGLRFLQLRSSRSNYFYTNSLSFSGHEIETVKPGEAPILLLGNSAVAGNNIPIDSTVADSFNEQLGARAPKMFNLGSMEQSLIESTIYLGLAAKYHPKTVVLGVNPASFAGLGGRELTIAYEDRLSDYFSGALVRAIIEENDEKKDFLPLIKKYLPNFRPSDFQLEFSNLVYDLRLHTFGSVYSAALKPGRPVDLGQLVGDNSLMTILKLKTFCELARRNGIRPVIYFTPIHERGSVFSSYTYDLYKKLITEHLRSTGVPYFSYEELLPATHDYFIDFIHVTPLGNRTVAKTLLRDLRANDLL